MTPRDWHRAKEIFHAALDHAGPQRVGYVREACGRDDSLRDEVERLLREHERSGEFLQTQRAGNRLAGSAFLETAATPNPAAPSLRSGSEESGTQIGRYKLLRQLGEGGFGSVWLAEQSEPVRRKVALKIIKLGMDTRQVIARFEAERQALAVMDHPHVAKVFDAGATETGRPYFVMEFVQGVPITEHCERHKLTVRERLELFISVCEAVQHAHQKGIIHRDLKPSNILVEIGDSTATRGNPKVIDFGIAKAITSPLTNMTLFTEQGQLIGTPAYMSPEQADLSAQDVDTRSDIYSLGVLLYELLTGTLPFDPTSLRTVNLAEIQRIIREVEPPTPSTKLGRLQPPPASRKLVRGDLDWITMKALEKDRTRRYASASDLAADIRRHMADEPVTAGAPTAMYRFRKYLRRNRTAVHWIGALICIASIAQVVYTRMAKERERVLRVERDRALHAEKVAKEERDRAQAVTNFIVRSLESQDVFAEGQTERSVADVMLHAVTGMESGVLADQPATQAMLLRTVAKVLTRNDRPDEAEIHAERALALEEQLHPGDHIDVAKSLLYLGHARGAAGKLAEAEPLFRRASEMHQRLLAGDSPDVLSGLFGLAGVYYSLGRPAEAEPLLEQALELSQRMYKDDHPDLAKALHDLAMVRETLGRSAEAESLYVQALAMGRRMFPGDHAHVALALTDLARCQVLLDKLPEALAHAREGAEMAGRVLPEGHRSRTVCEARFKEITYKSKDRQAREYWQLITEERWAALAAASNEAMRDQVNRGGAKEVWRLLTRDLGAFYAIESSQVIAPGAVRLNCRFEKGMGTILVGLDGDKLAGFRYDEMRGN